MTRNTSRKTRLFNDDAAAVVAAVSSLAVNYIQMSFMFQLIPHRTEVVVVIVVAVVVRLLFPIF